MRRGLMFILCLVIAGAALVAARLPAAGARQATPVSSAADTIVAPLLDAAGQEVGLAAFTTGDDEQARVAVIAAGLTPGEHGIHVHETGTCDPAGEKPFSLAGGHFNPTGGMHGEHAGDLGNLTADADGDVLFLGSSDRFALTTGETPLLDADGAALVIHADPDDLVTDPAGNSGTRVLCAVIAAGS